MATGTTLVVLGSYIYNQLTLYSYKNDMQLKELITTVIAVGCAFIVLGFLGFCGACCKLVMKLYVVRFVYLRHYYDQQVRSFARGRDDLRTSLWHMWGCFSGRG
ncbi:uncharacterized protein DEA37_0013076 [Paragonimus westermani]|uniref:Uncharacterized protein n=1 Tax=Paragonimus westermani TaxID=34504 RepID=A0A5J4N4X3_9TREM|nr:uncharacterized protein DEA37_0006943 [Paragonimus westermani]KAA3673369.1 uncharacterized protein DEA37_0013076 [Paragonimus westermani]